MNKAICLGMLLLCCCAGAEHAGVVRGDEQAAISAGCDRVTAAMRIISEHRADAQKLGQSVDFTVIQPQLDVLVAMEGEHRGTLAGRSAIFSLANLARSYSDSDLPIHQALRGALTSLESYGDHRDAMLLAAMLTEFSDPAALAALERLLTAPATLPEVREAAQLARAEWTFKKIAEKATFQEALKQVDDETKKRLQAKLEAFPGDAQLSEWRASAIRDLESLAASDSGRRQILFRTVDAAGEFIVTEDVERTNENPTFAQLAKGALFRELYLKRGVAAPELALKLLDGSRWSMDEQQTPIIFVQFCHEGCGPCEAMYPVLRKVLEKYPDSISVLTIMTDATDAPARRGVEKKKLTWNVAWNGANDDVAAQWGVRTYPDCFLFVGEHKRLLADVMAAEYLEQVVDALVSQPELMSFPQE